MDSLGDPLPASSVGINAGKASDSGKDCAELEPLLPAGGVEASMAPLDDEVPPSAVTNFAGAVLGCFMGTIGGMSIASTMFPPGTEAAHPRYYAIGLFAGLLTGTLSNLTLLFATSLPCGVGGTLFPPILVIGKYAQQFIGPDDPATVLAAYAVFTPVMGLLIFALGRLRLLKRLYELVPHAVLVGFLTSIGLWLFDMAIQTAVGPDAWPGLVYAHSWRTVFGDGHLTAQVCPGVLTAVAAVCVLRGGVLAQRHRRLLVPSLCVLMIAVVNTVHGAAERDGWLFDVTSDGTQFWDLWELGPYAGGSGLDGSQPIRWSKLSNGSFAAAYLFAVFLGIIALCEDLFMVYQFTGQMHPRAARGVDLDRELQLQGLQNVLTGLLGALPTNVVGSYSIAVIRTGTRGRLFFGVQAAGSLLFFAFAPHLMSVMPRMVPTFVLFLVGIEITLWGVWDLRPHRRRPHRDASERSDGTEALSGSEYAVVLVMGGISLVPVPGPYGSEINLIIMLCVGVTSIWALSKLHH